MPERTYKLLYLVDDQGAVTKLGAIRQGILGIDAAARGAKDAVGDLQARMGGAAAEASILSQNVAGATTSIQSLGASSGSLIPTWQALQFAIELAQQFGQAVNDAREHLRELARETIETRDQMRELANLQGHAGPDNEVAAQTIASGVQAGMTPDDARRFMEQFEGSIPAGRAKGNIRPELEPAVALEAMKFGTRVGLQPQTAGDLAGVLPQYGPIRSQDQAAGIIGKVTEGLNAGRGKLEPLTRSLIKTAGSIVEEQGGPVEDLPTLAALLGVASQNATPDRAGTMLKNAVQALRKFDGAKTPEEIAQYNRTHETPLKPSQGQTLQDLGITPQMKFLDALDRIGEQVRAADAAGTGGDVWLREHGFGNEDEIRGLVQLSRNLDVVHTRVGPRLEGEARQKELETTGIKTRQANEDFFTKERAGQARRLKAQTEAMDFLTGEKGELSEMAIMSGHQRLREEGQTGGIWNSIRYWFQDGGNTFPKLGLEKSDVVTSKERFMMQLQEEGEKVGVDVGQIYRDRGSFEDFEKVNGRFYVDRAKYFNQTPVLNEAIEAVIAKGGKPFGDDAQVQTKLRSLIRRDQARRGVQPPGAAPPLAPAAEAQVKADVAAALAGQQPGEVPAALPGAGRAPGAPELPGGGGAGVFAPGAGGGNAPVVDQLKKLNAKQEEANKLMRQQQAAAPPAGGNGFRPGRK